MSDKDNADDRAETGEQSRPINRRRFVKSLGVAGGATALGSIGTSRASASEQKLEKEELHGRKRGQILRSANASPKVEFVAEKLGTRGGVDSVFKYTLDDGTTGFGVTYGAGEEAEGATIRYYKSDSFESGSAVSGGKPSGDGSIGVVADGKVVLETTGTQRVNKAMDVIHNNDEYTKFKQELDKGSLKEENAGLAHTNTGTQEPTDILIPIVYDGEAVDRLVLSGPEWPSSANIQSYSVGSPSDESPVLLQDAPCGAICSVVSVGSYGACTIACASDPFTAPFALDCGTLCSAVVAGNCVPVCNNIT